MKNLNCPNCGAPINPETNKCLYCGTSYFDLSTIDMSNPKPFYLKIKIGKNIVTQLVIPDPTDITLDFRKEYTYYYGKGGIPLSSILQSQNLSTSIKFNAIPDKKNILYTITEDKD